MRFVSLCAAFAVVLAGCGHPELGIESSAGTTMAAGSAAVTFTATGGQGEYQWSLIPASLGTLSATEGESISFTPVGTMAVPTTGVLTVTSKEESASVEITVTPRAVTGRVISNLGMPVTGVLVALAGPAGTFTTTPVDGEGRFSFANVPPVYDLVVADYPARQFAVHRGLTRTDPTLVAVEPSHPLNDFDAIVRGTISGGSYPAPPPGHVTRVALEGTVFDLSNYPSDTADAAGFYELQVEYWGPASANTTLHALQVIEDADGRATGYAGYGKLANVGLSNGATLVDRNVALSAVASTVDFSGSIALPDGAMVVQKALFVQPGPGALLPVLQNDVDSSLDVPMPEIPGATVTAVAGAVTAFGTGITLRTGLPLNASGLSIAVPAAPQVLAPASGATGVTSATEFRWTDLDDATFVVQFEEAGTGAKIIVITHEPHTTIPDLTGLGVTLPRNANFDWLLISLRGMPDTDAYAEAGHTNFVYGPLNSQAPAERSFSQYLSTFTTAP